MSLKSTADELRELGDDYHKVDPELAAHLRAMARELDSYPQPYPGQEDDIRTVIGRTGSRRTPRLDGAIHRLMTAASRVPAERAPDRSRRANQPANRGDS